MYLTLRNEFGCTEAIIDEDCGLKRFYQVAQLLTEGLQINFVNKEDELDTLVWGFRYKNHGLILHYNIYTGISLYPQQFKAALKSDNEAVVELATYLEDRLFIHTSRKHLS
jgi:hypothetical protein